MNALTPLINSYIKPKHFWGRKISMEKLKSTLPNMLLSLTGISVIAGAIFGRRVQCDARADRDGQG